MTLFIIQSLFTESLIIDVTFLVKVYTACFYCTSSPKWWMMKALFDNLGFLNRACSLRRVLYIFWAHESSEPLGIYGKRKR